MIAVFRWPCMQLSWSDLYNSCRAKSYKILSTFFHSRFVGVIRSYVVIKISLVY